MFARLGNFISRYWVLVILAWIGVAVLSRSLAPRWDDVTDDGDLAYMPAHMSSVKGEKLLDQAFPRGRAKSEIVVIVSRDGQTLTSDDLAVTDQIAARLNNLYAVSSFQHAQQLWAEAAQLRDQGEDQRADRVFTLADESQRAAAIAWDEALRLDPQFGLALNNRAFYLRTLGMEKDAQKDQRLASDFDPDLRLVGETLQPADLSRLPIIDVWTRHNEVLGTNLRSRDHQADLVIVRLWQEFMASDNIRVLQEVESAIGEVTQAGLPEGLQVGFTGSAAVGGDMLRSAAESIKNTELYTIVLVVVILTIVYRSPLLVLVPLITIVISVVVSTSLVAALTQLNVIPGFDWWNFRIFTTTKIFVVVILFGAGTDYCLFLISRYREELAAGKTRGDAIVDSLQGVGGALAASALTTIIGLGMMFFAEFGKFRNSGPAIGLCLAVTLAACLTLTPALLRGMGGAVFWPLGVSQAYRRSYFVGIWRRLARIIVAQPGRVLVISSMVMLPFAVVGSRVGVTYDFLSELNPSRPSKVGAMTMRQHYPIGETGPLTLLAKTPDRDLDLSEGKKALQQLTRSLYLEGVLSVRSLDEPRGDIPRGYSLKKAALQSHQLTRSLYLSKANEQPGIDAKGSSSKGDIARFEIVLEHDPFAIESAEVLANIDDYLQKELANANSYWYKTEFLYAGTTSAIRDLRLVTGRDNVQIQILVVLAVLAVLLLTLRRPVICLYLILSVLFSYYVTIGLTELFFQVAYGETFQGLDWKVPLFLFVILVAIGQDYNIYLATRVFEEQAKHGMFGGLRRAIVLTGGIITSCGVIMAGTFVSMTTGTLRGMAELGFALSLGVLIDTFVVRPILVPAFLAVLFRRRTGAPPIGAWIQPPHAVRSRRRKRNTRLVSD
ncbi:MAG: MMPL family transporter [Planctomycetaceae bacterium]|nr:MMPL family transporter [Planctomycetaceae bacterium]